VNTVNRVFPLPFPGFKSIACTAFAIMAAGCTSHPLVQDYAPPVSSCCARAQEIAYSELPFGGKVDIAFAPSSPTYVIEGKPRHVGGVRIPSAVDPSSLIVTTYGSTTYLPMATAVVPDFIFLDEAFQIVGRAVADYSDYRGPLASGSFGLQTRVLVPAKTRYVIVTPGQPTQTKPIGYGGVGQRYSMPPAALGEISLQLYGHS